MVWHCSVALQFSHAQSSLCLDRPPFLWYIWTVFEVHISNRIVFWNPSVTSCRILCAFELKICWYIRTEVANIHLSRRKPSVQLNIHQNLECFCLKYTRYFYSLDLEIFWKNDFLKSRCIRKLLYFYTELMYVRRTLLFASPNSYLLSKELFLDCPSVPTSCLLPPNSENT